MQSGLLATPQDCLNINGKVERGERDQDGMCLVPPPQRIPATVVRTDEGRSDQALPGRLALLWTGSVGCLRDAALHEHNVTFLERWKMGDISAEVGDQPHAFPCCRRDRVVPRKLALYVVVLKAAAESDIVGRIVFGKERPSYQGLRGGRSPSLRVVLSTGLGQFAGQPVGVSGEKSLLMIGKLVRFDRSRRIEVDFERILPLRELQNQAVKVVRHEPFEP